ncbi:MAG: DUF4349 domain-containing protein [Kofleriaceae bacterium]|nr:DUF4349 domain-containing protein [Kofleriaceae bacterium]MCB9573362.1 DUF4349 domain-containing protein [Kofleriaceae bacterium]
MTPSNPARSPRPRPSRLARADRPPGRRRGRSLATGAALLALAFGACGKSQHEAGARAPAAEAAPAWAVADGKIAEERSADLAYQADAPTAGLEQPPAPTDNRKIVRTGELSLVVQTYDEARDRIDALVRAAGGYVDSTRVSHSEGQVSDAVIVLRVPVTQFGALLPQLRALGEIQAETTDASDITDQYVDVAARLKSARALEARLLELAATGTGKVTEVLEVERELARVRAEIEQYEGRIRLWDDQVSLSTLTLRLSTERPEIAAPAAPGFGERVSRTFHDSVDTLSDAGRSLLLGLVSMLPWLPLLIPGFFLGRRVLRRVALPRAIAYPAPAGGYPPPPPAPMPPPPPAVDDDDPAAA